MGKVNTVMIGRGVTAEVDQVEAVAGPPMTFPNGSADSRFAQTIRVREAVKNTVTELRADAVRNIRYTSATAVPAQDLAVAAAFLEAAGVLQSDSTAGYALVGELALSGAVRPVHGVALMVRAAVEAGLPGIVVPEENASEAIAAVPEGVEFDVLAPKDLQHYRDHIAGTRSCRAILPRYMGGTYNTDFSDVRGVSPELFRAIVIAVAGNHGLLFEGLPGSGRTMMSLRIPTILPELSSEASRRATEIQSVAGILSEPKVTRRPFRAPHYTVSEIGLVGAERRNRLGEVQLASSGVLMFDELPHFHLHTLEVGRAAILNPPTGAERPFIVAAADPCPCRYPTCRCEARREAYRERLKASAKALGLTIRVNVPIPNPTGPRGPESATLRASVTAARERQLARQGRLNEDLNEPPLERVARTIADLEGAEHILPEHYREAEELIG